MLGSKIIICPKCETLGYLIKEKPRPKKYRKTSRYYPTRESHPIFEVVHNIKKDGKWRPKRCYLGVFQKVLDFAKNLRGKEEPEWEHMALDKMIMIRDYYRLEDPSVGLPTDLQSRQNIADLLFHFSGKHKHKFSLPHKSPIKIKVDPRIPISF